MFIVINIITKKKRRRKYREGPADGRGVGLSNICYTVLNELLKDGIR